MIGKQARRIPMTNIAKIFAVAVTLVVGTGAVSGIALASVDHAFYPDRLENPNVSLPSPKEGSGIPSPYRVGNRSGDLNVSVPSSRAGSGVPSAYRIGN
jgi:hypothetical protein